MRQSIFILPDTYLCIHTAIPHTSVFYLYGGKIHLAPTSPVSLSSVLPSMRGSLNSSLLSHWIPLFSQPPGLPRCGPPASPHFPTCSSISAHLAPSIPASLLTLEHPRHFPNLEISHWLFPLPGTLFPQTPCSNAPSPARPSLGYNCQQLPHLVPAPHPAPASPLSVALSHLQ